MGKKSSTVRVNLGSSFIDRSTWEMMRRAGYSRDDIRQLIVQNGEDSLADYACEFRTPEEEEKYLDWRSGKNDQQD